MQNFKLGSDLSTIDKMIVLGYDSPYMKKSTNDNPMPLETYIVMLSLRPSDYNIISYDLHHALVDKGDVRGMPLQERKKIHSPLNLWWVSSAQHASHADIPHKRVFYRLLCERWGKEAVDDFIRSILWKSTPPVSVEWLNES